MIYISKDGRTNDIGRMDNNHLVNALISITRDMEYIDDAFIEGQRYRAMRSVQNELKKEIIRRIKKD